MCASSSNLVDINHIHSYEEVKGQGHRQTLECAGMLCFGLLLLYVIQYDNFKVSSKLNHCDIGPPR